MLLTPGPAERRREQLAPERVLHGTARPGAERKRPLPGNDTS
jgi:hypothetical protein